MCIFDINNNSYTCAAIFITKLQSVTVHSVLFSSMTCFIQNKACSYLPAFSLSALNIYKSHHATLPIITLNKEAYRGLPQCSCSVYSFFLQALQLSKAFPTVQRQIHFTKKIHEDCTPLQVIFINMFNQLSPAFIAMAHEHTLT